MGFDKHPRHYRTTRFANLIVLASSLVTTALILGNSIGAARPAPPVQNTALTDQEKWGKQIYLNGTSPSGKSISASLGDDGTALPGSTFACATCHGRYGKGNPEGGVAPTPLTWESLTKPYEVTSPSGRSHPAYTESLLKRAITMGVDSAGNRLQAPMPRFQMSIEDMADLVAYIKKLGRDADPGVTDQTIRLCLLGPPSRNQGPVVEAWRAAEAATAEYIHELNRAGGVYGRAIELAEIRADSQEGFDTEMDRTDAFAMISPLGAAASASSEVGGGATVRRLQQTGTPAIFAFPPSNSHATTIAPKSSVFYLYSGAVQQTRALCEFAARRGATNRAITRKPDASSPKKSIPFRADGISLVSVGEAGIAELATVAETECARLDLKIRASRSVTAGEFNPSQLVTELIGASSDAVIFLGSTRELTQFLNAAERRKWTPTILTIAGGEAAFQPPEGFKGTVLQAWPTVPADYSEEKRREYIELANRYGLSQTGLPTQFASLAATAMIVSVLKYIGRDVSREKVVAAMEKLYEYRTGLTPPLTYTPNRRIGALGAYIVPLVTGGEKSVPQGEWISVP